MQLYVDAPYHAICECEDKNNARLNHITKFACLLHNLHWAVLPCLVINSPIMLVYWGKGARLFLSPRKGTSVHGTWYFDILCINLFMQQMTSSLSEGDKNVCFCYVLHSVCLINKPKVESSTNT